MLLCIAVMSEYSMLNIVTWEHQKKMVFRVSHPEKNKDSVGDGISKFHQQ